MGNKGAGKLRKGFLFVLALLVLTGSLSGCTSLRKKFIRKKKVTDQTQDFIPVLEPVEYEQVVMPPLGQYREQYMLARAYFKDVWAAMGSVSAGDKQQVYVLKQLTVRLQAMADLLSGSKKDLLGQLIAQVGEVIGEYEKPAPLRRYDLLKGIVRKVEKSFRADFKPDAVMGNLANL